MTRTPPVLKLPANHDDFAIGRWTGIDESGVAAGVLYPPRRIQRKRIKGWRMPPNAIYVGRPTKWGNPFIVGEPFVRKKMQAGGGETSGTTWSAADAVHFYRRFLSLELRIAAWIHLHGKNLACWCPLNQPCHADVLLELANDDNPTLSRVKC